MERRCNASIFVYKFCLLPNLPPPHMLNHTQSEDCIHVHMADSFDLLVNAHCLCDEGELCGDWHV